MNWQRPAMGILILISMSARGATSAVLSNHTQELVQNLAENKKKIESAELKQRQILSGLFEINKKIKKTVTEKGNLSQRRVQLEVNIAQLTEKVQELENRSKSQKSLLAERLRALYKLSGSSMARYVFSSRSSVSLSRNLKILGIVAERDLSLIKNYNLDLKDLNSQKKVLAQRLSRLKSIESKITEQEKRLLAEQTIKTKLLDGVRKSKMFALKTIQGLREKSLQYSVEDAGIFDLLFKPSFADQKGELPIPVIGKITQKFGLIKGDNHPYTLTNKGVYISAEQGSPIRSVFDGRISFVGEISGFGTTLIVDHGDHYYTVYGHADAVMVNLGDEVTQAQQIASAANASGESPSGMYFEIRHFSEPYDPQLWTKGL